MDDKLLEELTERINKTKTNINYNQQGLAFLVTVERSTTKKIDTIKNDIILPKSRGRHNPFAMPYTELAKIYNAMKNNKNQ